MSSSDMYTPHAKFVYKVLNNKLCCLSNLQILLWTLLFSKHQMKIPNFIFDTLDL